MRRGKRNDLYRTYHVYVFHLWCAVMGCAPFWWPFMIQRTDDGTWSVDRKVPLALIATIIGGGLLHTCTLVWWGSGIDQRVGSLERVAERTAPQADRLTRVEEKIQYIQGGIDEIKALIRQQSAAKPR